MEVVCGAIKYIQCVAELHSDICHDSDLSYGSYVLIVWIIGYTAPKIFDDTAPFCLYS